MAVKKFPIGPIVRALGGDAGTYRSGKQKIRCINPAHDDKRPSASVDFTTNRYLCFGCGLGGDALDLIVTLEGISLSAAVIWAEGVVGTDGPATREKPAEAASLFDRPRTGRRS